MRKHRTPKRELVIRIPLDRGRRPKVLADIIRGMAGYVEGEGRTRRDLRLDWWQHIWPWKRSDNDKPLASARVEKVQP